MNEPVVTISDASSNEAELNAKIDAELGLPPQPIREETTEDEANQDTTDTDEDDSSQATEEDDTDDATGDSDEGATDDDETAEEVVPVEPATPSVDDLFIEIEDANGVTHKITTIEDLPEDFEPKNNRQIIEIIKQTDSLDAERSRREADAETAAEAAAVAETQAAQYKSWDNEITELSKTDRIKLTDTDRINEVFGHMNTINEARIKAGNPNLINSFEDALEKFERAEAETKAAEAAKKGNDIAKVKASMIGTSSAKAGNDNFVYRSGQYRSMDDIPL